VTEIVPLSWTYDDATGVVTAEFVEKAPESDDNPAAYVPARVYRVELRPITSSVTPQ
jgi:hypothetical protein